MYASSLGECLRLTIETCGCAVFPICKLEARRFNALLTAPGTAGTDVCKADASTSIESAWLSPMASEESLEQQSLQRHNKLQKSTDDVLDSCAQSFLPDAEGGAGKVTDKTDDANIAGGSTTQELGKARS